MNIKDFFKDENGNVNDEEFLEALNDAMLVEKLKQPSKFIIILEDFENKLKKKLNVKKDMESAILLANYKRYLYKHILELEKANKG